MAGPGATASKSGGWPPRKAGLTLSLLRGKPWEQHLLGHNWGRGGEGQRGARRGGKQDGRQACGQEWEEETQRGEVAGCRHGTRAWPLGNTSPPLPSKLGWVTPTRSLLALGLPPHLSDEGVPLWMRWPVRLPASGVLASC